MGRGSEGEGMPTYPLPSHDSGVVPCKVYTQVAGPMEGRGYTRLNPSRNLSASSVGSPPRLRVNPNRVNPTQNRVDPVGVNPTQNRVNPVALQGWG